MKNIFLLGFTGGSCGDFLCSQISKDDNFYSLQSSMNPDLNRCELENPFANFGIDIKNPYWPESSIISNTDYKKIDIAYSEKNLVLPIHYFLDLDNINLPRLAGIKLCSNKLTPLFYILLWIKRWRLPVNIGGSEDDVIKCAGKNLKLIEKSKEIIDRGYFYSFEKPALRLNISNSIDLTIKYFFNYASISKKAANGWIPYNLDNLFLNTIDNVTEFSQLFNMTCSINSEDLIQYHQNNIKLVETYFNKTYDSLILGNWLLDLREKIKTECPSAYSI